jgi:hypothetical protein
VRVLRRDRLCGAASPRRWKLACAVGARAFRFVV